MEKKDILLSFKCIYIRVLGFPGGSVSKESACSIGEPGSIPALGRSPGEGNGNPLHYSCLRNHLNRGDCWATVDRGHKELNTESSTHKELNLANINTKTTQIMALQVISRAVKKCIEG